ncbi:hypothetical protein LY78DRAFT_42849 [Colletotrichum sublineola]|nr:hypothetical protein LY78DRAFT_42849 [Colletotrichum sublineola]
MPSPNAHTSHFSILNITKGPSMPCNVTGHAPVLPLIPPPPPPICPVTFQSKLWGIGARRLHHNRTEKSTVMHPLVQNFLPHPLSLPFAGHPRSPLPSAWLIRPVSGASRYPFPERKVVSAFLPTRKREYFLEPETGRCRRQSECMVARLHYHRPR